jgi:hypothetical protein
LLAFLIAMTPDLPTTLGIFIGAMVVGGLANWQLRRPFHERLFPLVPWMKVQFVVAFVAIIMAAHLISLITGHELQGRTNY